MTNKKIMVPACSEDLSDVDIIPFLISIEQLRTFIEYPELIKFDESGQLDIKVWGIGWIKNSKTGKISHPPYQGENKKLDLLEELMYRFQGQFNLAGWDLDLLLEDLDEKDTPEERLEKLKASIEGCWSCLEDSFKEYRKEKNIPEPLTRKEMDKLSKS